MMGAKETNPMAAPPTIKTEWQWPVDVVAFATANQVQPYLAPLLDATWRVFRTACRVQVYLEDDPEIRDDWHIVFEVEAPGLSATEALAAQNRWNRELFGLCPGPLVCTFRLRMRLGD
jgi:hypothetical protein